MKLKIKINLFIGLLLCFTIASVSSISLYRYGINQKHEYEGKLKDYVGFAKDKIVDELLDSLLDYKNNDIESIFISEREKIALKISQLIGLDIKFYNKTGMNLSSSIDLIEEDVLNLLSEEKDIYIRDGNFIYYYSFVTLENFDIGILSFNMSIESYNEAYMGFCYNLILISIIILAIGILTSSIFARKLSDHILTLKNQAEDITKGKFLNKRIIKNNDELDDLENSIYKMSCQIQSDIGKLEAMRAKQREFLCAVTHEFKTPLANIRAYADAMSLYSDDEKLMNNARAVINSETIRLTEMVDEVLSYEKLDKYFFDMHFEICDVYEIISKAVLSLEKKAEKYQVDIIIEKNKLLVMADYQTLYQVFMNLIDNGIKYNVNGGTVKIIFDENDKNYIVDVIDSGIGIDEEIRNYIFDEFRRGDSSRNKKIEGYGLGLSIAKKIMKKHNGDLILKKSSEKGSEFRVILLK